MLSQIADAMARWIERKGQALEWATENPSLLIALRPGRWDRSFPILHLRVPRQHGHQVIQTAPLVSGSWTP